MCTTDDEVCRLRKMFYKIKYIVFKTKILFYCCVVQLEIFLYVSETTGPLLLDLIIFCEI